MSKRKQHNPIKRLITQSRLATHDLALVMSLNHKLVDAVSTKTGKPIPISQALASALDRTAFKWLVVLAAHCIESNGKQKLCVDIHKLAAEYKHGDLTMHLRNAHQELIDECNAKMHVVNASWLAIPTPRTDADEDKLIKMLLDKPEFWVEQEIAA